MKAINKDRRKEYPVRVGVFSRTLVQMLWYLPLCRVVALAVGIACVCQPCDGAAAVQPLPLLPSLRSGLTPERYHLKTKLVFITQHFLIKERIMWWDSQCFIHVILNMNCFSCESHAAVREIKLKGKYLEYLYLYFYSRRLAKESNWKFFTKWEKNQSV